MAGRPTKLTPEVQHKICLMIRLGQPHHRACIAGGISVSSFREWLSRGRTETSGIYHEFLLAIESAEAECERVHVENLNKIAVGDLRYLETRKIYRNGELCEVIETEKTVLPDAATSRFVLRHRFPDAWSEDDKVDDEKRFEATDPQAILEALQEIADDDSDD